MCNDYNLSLFLPLLYTSIKNCFFTAGCVGMSRNQPSVWSFELFFLLLGCVVSSRCGERGEQVWLLNEATTWQISLVSNRLILVFIKRRKALLAVVFHLREPASLHSLPFVCLLYLNCSFVASSRCYLALWSDISGGWGLERMKLLAANTGMSNGGPEWIKIQDWLSWNDKHLFGIVWSQCEGLAGRFGRCCCVFIALNILRAGASILHDIRLDFLLAIRSLCSCQSVIALTQSSS